MTQKVEFAGPEWMAAIESKFRTYAEGPGRDSKLSICEVFTGVPKHLDPDGTGRIAWHCFIGGGKLKFAYGEIDGADIKNIADYDTILPFARLRLTPETQEEYQRMAEAAMAAGKLQRLGDPAKVPQALHGLHNEMADITV